MLRGDQKKHFGEGQLKNRYMLQIRNLFFGDFLNLSNIEINKLFST